MSSRQLSVLVRLLGLGVLATFLASTGFSQILEGVDKRSSKGKVGTGDQTTIVVEIRADAYRFREANLSGKALLERLDDEMDTRSPDNRTIFVTSVPATPFNCVADLLKLGRSLEVDDFALMSSAVDTKAAVPVKIILDEPGKTRPKPWSGFLGVELLKDGSLTLNRKVVTEETLVDSLVQVFATRQQKHFYISGSKDVDKTVFVRVSLSTKFEDLMRILKTVQSSGAYPIALEIDWLS